MRNDITDYPENSRSAVLRVAIMVADSDGSWTELEREQLESVYRNICTMLDDDLEDEQFYWELETISSDVSDEIESLTDDEEIEAYWQVCIEPIVSRDIQELAVGAALAIASADSEIDPEEMSCLARLCKDWDVNVKDAEEIWND